VREAAARAIGSVGGLGYAPFAPGTVTSFAVLLPFALVPGFSFSPLLFAGLLLLFIAGLWAATVMEGMYGEDPSQVTVDELVGQWISLALLPQEPFVLLLGFALFRFFDIVKPEPVDSAQRLPGGWGVMVDDILAGVYANLSVRLILFVLSYTSVSFAL